MAQMVAYLSMGVKETANQVKDFLI